MTRLALLGDSIAWGQGAAREEDRLAARLVRGLAVHGVQAETEVFARPGTRSAGLSLQVDRALEWHPDVSVVVIGANDLTHLVPTAEAVTALGEAIQRLVEARSEVVLAPAPDLSSLPHVPAGLRQLLQVASVDLRRRQVQIAQKLGARVADTGAKTAQAFAADPRLFSADRFHPSSAGYEVIAEVLLPEILAGARAAHGRPP